MRQTSTLVVFKDGPESDVRYFGPFVDIVIAQEFAKALVEPLPGGFKGYRSTQPYTSNETSLINDVIKQSRLTDTAKRSYTHEAI